MSTADLRSIQRVRDFAPLPPSQRRAGAVAHVVRWLERQRQRAALAELDSRLLADIGITAADAVREARRWF